MMKCVHVRLHATSEIQYIPIQALINMLEMDSVTNLDVEISQGEINFYKEGQTQLSTIKCRHYVRRISFVTKHGTEKPRDFCYNGV